MIAKPQEELPGRPIADGKKEIDDSGCVVEQQDARSSVQSDKTVVEDSSRPTSITGRPPVSCSNVRVLSYNIFLRPPGITNNTSDYKNARLSHFATAVLPGYDVVCLQEIYSSGSTRMSKLLVQAKKYGFEYHVASPSKGILNTSVDGGLLILSRYPIVKTDKITYKRGINVHSRFQYSLAIVCQRRSSSRWGSSFTSSNWGSTGLQIPSTHLFHPPASPLFGRARTRLLSQRLFKGSQCCLCSFGATGNFQGIH
ncbi:hypothetical protein BCR33DRAFT_571763 [Rhizoclosmatium globosum]|uniref:Endonuclease/exonuclease/phosphatase domain-containing protein n=1 Tax=Rhizoclosmatium globosum TaxID=329046 RepID=A0A1Y2B5Y9_9FUNG|nr:hypothetical protein BCR33DRAFT_571763 [Rhizoclosmatium globosum]|eukprot:ORY29897.1 hypothetical protein BCR33DRAFT_571763 [Rhizoclosmatium globosum]